MSEAPKPTIRVDKWLWQARFFKTRTLAAKVVTAGKVRVNTVAISKPSRTIGVGDVLTFAQGKDVRVIRLLALGERRGPAPEARALYDDLSPPAPSTPKAPRHPGHDRVGRPTKRDRRAFDRLEGGNSGD